MALLEIRWNPTPRELRLFAAMQAAFLGFVAWLVFRRTGSMPASAGLAGFGLAAGAVGLAWPRLIRWLYVAWMAVTWPIGWCVSHAVMALVYFGVFTPIGLLMRATGRDPMTRRLDRGAASYWVARPAPPAVSRYFRQS